MTKNKKSKLLSFLATLIICLVIASFFPKTALAVGCGETYLDSDSNQGIDFECTCGYSLDQIIRPGGLSAPDTKCCGLEYEGECYDQDEYDDITAAVIAVDSGEVECGELFQINSDATCNCSNQVYYKTVAGNDQYCCGWISDDSCLDDYAFEMCRQIADDGMRAKCEACQNEGTSVWTAIGCIPTDHTSIIQVFIKLGVVSGGGISLLIILAGSFMLSISQGDPKKTSEAKEMITSAIIGLIFIIFSVSILQLIGVQILHIPGFAD